MPRQFEIGDKLFIRDKFYKVTDVVTVHYAKENRTEIMRLNLETEIKIKERYSHINDIETIIFELEKIEESEDKS